MKLTNQQINALANSFYNEIIETQKLKNEAKKKQLLEEYRPYYKSGVVILKNNPILKSIEIKINKNITLKLEPEETFESFVTNWNLDNIIARKLKEKTLNVDSIKQDIILATINTQSIEDITKILKVKYK